MKMIFKLSDKQLDNIKFLVAEANDAFRKALGDFPMEQWMTRSDIQITGYHDDIRNKYYLWLGVLGFLRVDSKHNVPDLTVELNTRRLIITGNREVITQPELIEKIAKVLGKSWRVAEPEIEDEDLAIKLFWWESVEHYARWRSDWNTYFSWLVPQIDPEKGIQKFDDRFRDENLCLQLLKSGKLIEARQRFPNLVDQILAIA